MGFQLLDRLPLRPVIRVVLEIAEPLIFILPVDVFRRSHTPIIAAVSWLAKGLGTIFIPAISLAGVCAVRWTGREDQSSTAMPSTRKLPMNR